MRLDQDAYENEWVLVLSDLKFQFYSRNQIDPGLSFETRSGPLTFLLLFTSTLLTFIEVNKKDIAGLSPYRIIIFSIFSLFQSLK